MGRFGKVSRYALGAFLALGAVLLLVGFLASDKLTDREAAELIAAADEPCRAAYAGLVDLPEGAEQPGAAQAGEHRVAASAGEAVCRDSFGRLDRVNLFIPPKAAGYEARRRRAAIDACAALSRARADLLAHHASGSPGAQRRDALEAELVRSDEACRTGFARLAGR